MLALRLVRPKALRSGRPLVVFGLLSAFSGALAEGADTRAADGMLDLSRAVVVAPRELSGPEGKAVTMLVEEVHKRSQLHWPVVHGWPEGAQPVIAVGRPAALKTIAGRSAAALANDPRAEQPEGFQIASAS